MNMSSSLRIAGPSDPTVMLLAVAVAVVNSRPKHSELAGKRKIWANPPPVGSARVA